MSDDIAKIFIEAALELVSSATLLLGAWGIGNRLSVEWNLRQKRAEHDLDTARDFHVLYGEFFATWKLWNYYVRDVGASSLKNGSRWDLLLRACESEGNLEAMFVRLACERNLSEVECECLGRFRQSYQRLREAIRDDRALDWNQSTHPEYVDFKNRAVQVACIAVGPLNNKIGSKDGMIKAITSVTSNVWETTPA